MSQSRTAGGAENAGSPGNTRIPDFRRLALTFVLLFLVNGLLSSPASAFDGHAPDHLQCEAMQEPLGIDIAHPRLSWQLQDSRRGARQAAYEIRVASSPESLAQDRADVWDSGRVESDQSVDVPYSGPAVESRRRYYWQVRVWDPQGQASSYSQASWWEMGLLSPQDWKAKWITPDMPLERGDYESAPKWIWAADDNALTKATPGKHDFRFNFKLAQKPKEATLFITAKDNVAAWVNGKQVVVESPMGNFGRAQDPWGYFRVLPVGKLLHAGANSLAAEAIVQQERNRPPQAGFIALLRVQMADGKIERFVSGPDWKTGPEQTGNAWVVENFDDSSWPAAAVVAEIGEAPLGTPWPAQPVDLLRRNFNLGQAGAERPNLFDRAGSLPAVLERSTRGQRCSGSGLDRLSQAQLCIRFMTLRRRCGKVAMPSARFSAKAGTPTAWAGCRPDITLVRLRYECWCNSKSNMPTAPVIPWSATIRGKPKPSPILTSDIYNGETYDARLEESEWDQPSFSDSELGSGRE